MADPKWEDTDPISSNVPSFDETEAIDVTEDSSDFADMLGVEKVADTVDDVESSARQTAISALTGGTIGQLPGYYMEGMGPLTREQLKTMQATPEALKLKSTEKLLADLENVAKQSSKAGIGASQKAREILSKEVFSKEDLANRITQTIGRKTGTSYDPEKLKSLDLREKQLEKQTARLAEEEARIGKQISKLEDLSLEKTPETSSTKVDAFKKRNEILKAQQETLNKLNEQETQLKNQKLEVTSKDAKADLQKKINKINLEKKKIASSVKQQNLLVGLEQQATNLKTQIDGTTDKGVKNKLKRSLNSVKDAKREALKNLKKTQDSIAKIEKETIKVGDRLIKSTEPKAAKTALGLVEDLKPKVSGNEIANIIENLGDKAKFGSLDRGGPEQLYGETRRQLRELLPRGASKQLDISTLRQGELDRLKSMLDIKEGPSISGADKNFIAGENTRKKLNKILTSTGDEFAKERKFLENVFRRASASDTLDSSRYKALQELATKGSGRKLSLVDAVTSPVRTIARAALGESGAGKLQQLGPTVKKLGAGLGFGVGGLLGAAGSALAGESPAEGAFEGVLPAPLTPSTIKLDKLEDPTLSNKEREEIFTRKKLKQENTKLDQKDIEDITKLPTSDVGSLLGEYSNLSKIKEDWIESAINAQRNLAAQPDSPAKEVYMNDLQKAMNTDQPEERNRLLFDLYQQPAFRKMINKETDETES